MSSGDDPERRTAPVPRGRPPSTTREAIGRAALALFLSRGFEATTIDDIAEAVGVGRRTVFRYFSSKNDMVWGDFDAVNARLGAELAGQPADRSVMEAVRAAVIASNRYPVELETELRSRITLITTVPALQAHSMLRYADWRGVVCDYAARRRGEDDPSIWSQALGYAALGASMAAFSRWAQGGGDLEELLERSYAGLASGFADHDGSFES